MNLHRLHSELKIGGVALDMDLVSYLKRVDQLNACHDRSGEEVAYTADFYLFCHDESPPLNTKI
jgi:hypothetical protein